MSLDNVDLLKTAKALIDMDVDRSRRVQHAIDTRAALLIGLDIARSLRNIYYSLERQNP